MSQGQQHLVGDDIAEAIRANQDTLRHFIPADAQPEGEAAEIAVDDVTYEAEEFYRLMRESLESVN
ncbi:hypothetical protein [Blastopirellula marina]|uniref:hypothetical protein n=1 Tax=Blastopirellula marina TaxID=124 RepID=UPI000CFA6E77|nr:hypothetical protein [Blastopirellula marina]